MSLRRHAGREPETAGGWAFSGPSRPAEPPGSGSAVAVSAIFWAGLFRELGWRRWRPGWTIL